jgi:lipopolysaccharide export LptBFGC system permease protein LptF
MVLLRKCFSPSLYGGRLFVRTIFEVCLLAVLVEAIFLSERSISILRMIIDEPIGLSNFVPLLGWTAPEVHIALPIAVLIAVYRMILRSRERLEFIALASGGQSAFPLLRSSMLVALLVLVSSLLISGVVAPYSKFSFRHDVDEVRYEALRAGSKPGQFLHFPNYTIYVFPSDKGQMKRPVFVKQIIDDKTYRIVNSGQTDLIDGPRAGHMTIRMFDVTINNLPNQNEHWRARRPERFADAGNFLCSGCDNGMQSLRTVSLMKELDLGDLVHFEPRGATLEEWTTPELLGWTAAPGNHDVSPDVVLEALHRLARALLCFLAPFLAWLILTLTTRRSLAFALPVACAVLMCADIMFSQLISVAARSSAAVATIALVAVAMGLFALLARQTVARQQHIVFPALARS